MNCGKHILIQSAITTCSLISFSSAPVLVQCFIGMTVLWQWFWVMTRQMLAPV